MFDLGLGVKHLLQNIRLSPSRIQRFIFILLGFTVKPLDGDTSVMSKKGVTIWVYVTILVFYRYLGTAG